MKADVLTKMEVTILFRISEEEAMGLQGICDYNSEDLCDYLSKFVHGYEKGSPERKGLISLLQSAKQLYGPLEEVRDVRKKYANIKIQ